MEFVLEGSLKGLARLLRFLGFNCFVLDKKLTTHTIFQNKGKIFLVTSPESARILEKLGQKFILLPLGSPDFQLKLLSLKIDLPLELKLNICAICGTPLKMLKKEEVKGLVPERVYNYAKEYTFCPKCNKIYWKGDHIKRLEKRLKNIINF